MIKSSKSKLNNPYLNPQITSLFSYLLCNNYVICICNWPLPIGAFQDQWKQKMIIANEAADPRGSAVELANHRAVREYRRIISSQRKGLFFDHIWV